MHLGEHTVCFREGTALDVEQVEVCDLDQLVSDQAEVFHVTGCEEILLDDVVCLAFFDILFVDGLGRNGTRIPILTSDDELLVPNQLLVVTVQVCVGQFAEQRPAVPLLREHEAVPVHEQLLEVVVVLQFDLAQVARLHPRHLGHHHLADHHERLHLDEELVVVRVHLVQLLVEEDDLAVELLPLAVLGAALLVAQVLRLTACHVQVRKHCVVGQQVVLVQHPFEHSAVLEEESLALFHAHDGLDQQVVERRLEHRLVGHLHASPEHAQQHRSDPGPGFVEGVDQRVCGCVVTLALLDQLLELDELGLDGVVHVNAEVAHQHE